MEHIIGIDLGGTTISGGLIEDEILLNEVTRKTEAEKGGEVTLNNVKEIIQQLKTTRTKAVGIGVPSVVDSDKGIVYHVQNIKNWEEVHLKSILEKEFSLPIYINNG